MLPNIGSLVLKKNGRFEINEPLSRVVRCCRPMGDVLLSVWGGVVVKGQESKKRDHCWMEGKQVYRWEKRDESGEMEDGAHIVRGAESSCMIRGRRSRRMDIMREEAHRLRALSAHDS